MFNIQLQLQNPWMMMCRQGVLATPDDIDFATNGDLIIADCDNSRICVLPLTSPGLEPDIAVRLIVLHTPSRMFALCYS